ncbi:hypothetical protein [Agromyces laixinhei]|uniref:hypothetical protein n=1 Tax=Agromyces laixinhei TaxID=2585717 RepID=UPI001116294B|nr:hypothetical protein [Agromyces laixinhei]
MFRLASFHRLVTAVCLALWAVLSVVFVFTAPPLDGSGDGASPLAAVVSAYAFLAAQAALVVGIIGVAHLLRDRTPVLAPIAALLTILGAVGHSAFAGISLVLAGGADGAPAAVEAALQGPAAALSMVSLVGAVVGVIVLAIALFRAALGATWIGIVLLGWVVVEFFLSGIGLWAMLGSAALLLVGYGAIAVVVFRSDLRDWMTAKEAEVAARRAVEPASV